MKVLKKLLTLLPLFAIGGPLITIMVAFGLSFGETAGDTIRMCDTCSWKNPHFSLWNALEITNKPEKWGFAIGIEIFMLVSILILIALWVLSFLNLSNKLANGPLMLILGIVSFFVPFLMMVAPIGISDLAAKGSNPDYYLTDLGVGMKVCCWVAFGLSWLIFLSFIIVFLLNVLLFKRLEKRRAEKEAAAKAQAEQQQ